MGKSTLCWHLCRIWDASKSLQQYKIVLYIQLRKEGVQKASSLNELLLRSSGARRQSLVDELEDCEGEGVLLIFDGFDELPSSIASDDSSWIMNLIQGNYLLNATRLVTSRPSADCKSIFSGIEYRHVEILGFTQESKKKFAENIFKSKPEVSALFCNFVFSNPIIESLMDIPINCAIMALIYDEIDKSDQAVS